MWLFARASWWRKYPAESCAAGLCATGAAQSLNYDSAYQSSKCGEAVQAVSANWRISQPRTSSFTNHAVGNCRIIVAYAPVEYARLQFKVGCIRKLQMLNFTRSGQLLQVGAVRMVQVYAKRRGTWCVVICLSEFCVIAAKIYCNIVCSQMVSLDK
uniref:Uncharacterized protein n=1 Tax=Spironucleus salmonicida TaxID=348837 RepID=V6LXC7_9EUKA|eukprot:EST48903.1 Hypothetical protein SS50377_10876 [Spironucleus salmonicida]